MRKNTNGFTIVELIIVIVVILILTAITVLTYVAVRKNSQTSAADSIARNVMSAAEQYYGHNGAYPDAKTIAGVDVNKIPPAADYSTIATNLDVPSSALSSSAASLVLCDSAVTACASTGFTSGYVYYLSRDATGSNNNASVTFTPGGCTISFNSTTAGTADSGSSSYVLVYQKASDNSWVYLPSAKTVNQTSLQAGTGVTYNVAISGSGCAWSN